MFEKIKTKKEQWSKKEETNDVLSNVTDVLLLAAFVPITIVGTIAESIEDILS